MAVAQRYAKPWERYASISPCAECPVRACAVCADVRPSDRARLQRSAERILVPARHVVGAGNVRDGTVRDGDLLTLVAGVVMAFVAPADGARPGARQVTRQVGRQVMGFHFPGDILGWPRDGEAARARDAPRVVLKSLTAADICRIEGAHLERLRQGVPELFERLLSVAEQRIDAAREHIVVLGRGTAEQRVAWFLMGLARRTGAGDGDGSAIDLPMARADIADYLGLEVETVSRIFSRLRADGVLSLASPKQVMLRDRRALAALAGGTMLGEGSHPTVVDGTASG